MRKHDCDFLSSHLTCHWLVPSVFKDEVLGPVLAHCVVPKTGTRLKKRKYAVSHKSPSLSSPLKVLTF